jgi:hypothetical protein
MPSILPILLLLLGASWPSPDPIDLPVGIGVAQVRFTEAPLYFYGDAASHPSATLPFDSLTFQSGPHHVEIAYAPPWLTPEVLKLDYDLLYFRVVSLRRAWVEVVVHTSDVRWPPQTMWIDREAVAFLSWPEFLLGVFSVESLDPISTPLRLAPDDSAAPAAFHAQADFRVIAVQSDWMLVEGTDANESHTPRGWLRWRRDERLLIAYNLLS